MPTAAEYREGALHYARLGENVRRHAALVGGWRLAGQFDGQLDGQFGQGSVAMTVSERLSWAAADLRQAGDELARLASTCSARAEVCDDYRRAVNAWLATPISERGLAPYPSVPHAWVSI